MENHHRVMNRRLNHGKSYKKTTSKQYSVMAREISKFSDRDIKDKEVISHFWNDLKDRLNALGPPTRNITEWKKVWNDCKRSRRRQEFIRMTLKKTKDEPIEVNDDQTDYQEEHSESNYRNGDSISQQDSISQHSFEHEITPNESNSMYSEYTPVTSNQNPYPFYNESDNEEPSPIFTRLTPTKTHHLEHQFETVNMEDTDSPLDYLTQSRPPPLHKPATARNAGDNSYSHPDISHSNLVQHTLYTLQNQMEHQTKMLEHMSRISSSMALLMERQVLAVQKQTEAARRQAIAMEHHTLVMNTLVNIVKDRMPKCNSNSNNRTMNS